MCKSVCCTKARIVCWTRWLYLRSISNTKRDIFEYGPERILKCEAQRVLFCVATALMPTPWVCDHLFQVGSIRRPAQFGFCAQWSWHQFGAIPGAARSLDDGDGTVCDMFALLHPLHWLYRLHKSATPQPPKRWQHWRQPRSRSLTSPRHASDVDAQYLR